MFQGLVVNPGPYTKLKNDLGVNIKSLLITVVTKIGKV